MSWGKLGVTGADWEITGMDWGVTGVDWGVTGADGVSLGQTGGGHWHGLVGSLGWTGNH